MKFTIDTNKKEVQLQETVNVSDLLNKLQDMLGDEYTEYSIIPKVEIEFKFKEVKVPNTNPLTPHWSEIMYNK